MDFVRVYNEALPLLLAGIKMTVLISLIALAIGMVLGLVSCLLSISKNVILRFISGVYIWIIRGTPMIVQAFIIYFGMPQLIQKLINPAFRLGPLYCRNHNAQLKCRSISFRDIPRRDSGSQQGAERGGKKPWLERGKNAF